VGTSSFIPFTIADDFFPECRDDQPSVKINVGVEKGKIDLDVVKLS
jgi:hypothetical protein